MSRDPIPRLQALMQAFKRLTGAPGMADTSFEAQDEPLYGLPDGDGMRDGPEASGDACPTTPVSVVIANCRGPESTARCLAAVLAQRFDPASFEVVIVDDSASDEVRAMVQALTPVGGAPAVRYVHTDNGGGPIAARNLGWRAASGTLIAFADDRSLPDPDWLASGERAMRAGHLALGGSVCVPASKRQTTAAQLQKLHGASAFVRREALDRIGGFDERCAAA